MQSTIDEQLARISNLTAQSSANALSSETQSFKTNLKLKNLSQKHQSEVEGMKQNIIHLESECLQLRDTFEFRLQSSQALEGTQRLELKSKEDKIAELSLTKDILKSKARTTLED